MILLYEGLKETNQDVKIYCPTLKGGFYFAPWFAVNPAWENTNFWFIEGLGNEDIRKSTMLEF